MNVSLAPKLERSTGSVRLSFKSSPAGTALERLYQQGCCKVRFPQSDDGTTEAVLLNTAGGLTDGDSVSNEIHWRRNTRATVTTQAAERVYRAATNDDARVATRITIDDDAMACWLPQETIVFDGARLARTLEIDMTSTSCLVALESTVLGRREMGETVNRGRFSDRWRIRIDGRLAFADHFLLDDQYNGRIAEFLGRVSATNSAHSIATLVIVANDCDGIVAGAREVVTPAGCTIGATCLEGLVIVRVLAGESRAMRAAVSDLITTLRGIPGIRLPRVWHC